MVINNLHLRHRFYNALSRATVRKLPQIVEYLLSNRGNVDPDTFQDAINGSFAMLSWESDRFNERIIDKFVDHCARIPVHDICYHNNLRLFKYLESKNCFMDVMKYGFSSLCIKGNLEFVKHILKKKIYSDNIEEIGNGCYWAGVVGKFDNIPYILEQKPECVHNVPVFCVFLDNREDIFELLVKHGKNIYDHNYFFFLLALRTQNDYFIKRLLEICNGDIVHLQNIAHVNMSLISSERYLTMEEGIKRREVLVNSILKRKLMNLIKPLGLPNECMTIVINYLV